MNDGATVAWIALALTAAVQLAGVAFWFGVLSQKVSGLRRDFDYHRQGTPQQTHGVVKE